MWVAHDPELGGVNAGVCCAIAAELARGDESSQRMCHLNVDEMRCVEPAITS